MSSPPCDVCGGTNPPRNPLWRSNTEKICDPCWDRINERIGRASLDFVAWVADKTTDPEIFAEATRILAARLGEPTEKPLKKI